MKWRLILVLLIVGRSALAAAQDKSEGQQLINFEAKSQPYHPTRFSKFRESGYVFGEKRNGTA
jgi:hypothetical protein